MVACDAVVQILAINMGDGVKGRIVAKVDLADHLSIGRRLICAD